ncbi:protein-L-isoaspartate(D-aspartate) O-methyltransferase [Methanoplanus endosymbiosus]|uniref:Protein-L-isoaspartate O-methyltransferase n=1 Tax=Methanoplanus endosymbiosus TaxID=33865 RepID=A0A9E7PQI6_9EURY|nr:protein-L-isoaspartate(D-aspartate) O-methyltransferase [Methanoplanus endosymbiosus]UUX93527.1 protein-L-isoaspartate(D-aspartate) O-methyltransferase [Methanoplanus endosymbiosus]
MDEEYYRKLRMDMVEYQIRQRGVVDKSVLAAMEKVPRHIFIPKDFRRHAYSDQPLPIGYGQTISQPYIVGIMTELLSPQKSDRVLEIGAGSGYQSAVLAEIVHEVISVEIVPELAKAAEENLRKSGIYNVKVICADGTGVARDYGIFDCIIITAASPQMPDYLFLNLNEGGRMVVPVGDYYSQTLMRIRMTNGEPVISSYGGVRFVPLTGKRGWRE